MISFWLWTSLVVTAAAGPRPYLDCHFLPGWEQSGTMQQHTPENLYDYKDGAAEGYLQFGFARMQSIECKSGSNTLAIDVSEMSDAEMAYGMFSANRDPRLPVAKIGMGAQVQAQSLIFGKGRYYVELTVTDAPPEADFKSKLEEFAGRMNERMEGSATPPEILAIFPKENLMEARLIPESVLGLGLLKRGYVAKYAQGQAFLVEEASPTSAAEVMNRLREHFAGAEAVNIGDEAIDAKVQYLDGICIFRKGRYVAGYANLPSAAAAAAQAANLATRLR